jgi:hypothetical protein
VADTPRTEYLAHDDGRWIECTLDSFQQRALGTKDEGGLIIGRDPECDIVIDDDGIEDFHVRLFGRGHHPSYIECIAGTAVRGEMTLHPGDEMRGSGTFAGWREASFDETRAPAALRAALSIARDAELEGRRAEADAIRLQAGYRKIRVPWRKQLPARLAHAQTLLRVRVEVTGHSEVHVLGSFARLTGGITIGSDPHCEVVVPAAGANAVTLTPRDGEIRIEVRAGVVREMSVYARGDHTDSFRISRWQRFGLGEAIVQLCRWPKRGEALR